DAISAFLRGDQFELAGYKGARLSFRSWDGQLRQPILLADARSLVSVSPPPGRFLHQFSELDPLGIDRPESKCRMGWRVVSLRAREWHCSAPPALPRPTPFMYQTRKPTRSRPST